MRDGWRAQESDRSYLAPGGFWAKGLVILLSEHVVK